MTEKELQARITQNGKPARPELYEINIKMKTLTTIGDDLSFEKLHINFSGKNGWAFDIGDGCTLIAGNNCKINTAYGCVITAGKKSTIDTSYDCIIRAEQGSVIRADDVCKIIAGEKCTILTGNECTIDAKEKANIRCKRWCNIITSAPGKVTASDEGSICISKGIDPNLQEVIRLIKGYKYKLLSPAGHQIIN